MRTFKRLILLGLVVALLGSCGQRSVLPLLPELPAGEQEEPSEPARSASSAFGESPMLTALVESGKLPPVDERLPIDPLVVNPPEIGEYGGELRVHGLWEGDGAFNDALESSQEGLLDVDASYDGFLPGVAKRWELAEDGKRFTVYLREGMRWSDGDDFNAADFALWYEILRDPEITERVAEKFRPDGELMGVQQIDDHTVQYTFARPDHAAVEAFGVDTLWAPAHRLQQYRPKLNDDAEAQAQLDGYDSWREAIWDRLGGYSSDPAAPQLNPWIIKERGAGSVIWERNLYYCRVDTAGNQLPYIDTILHIISGDVRTVGPRLTMAGSLTLRAGWRDLRWRTFPSCGAMSRRATTRPTSGRTARRPPRTASPSTTCTRTRF